MGNSVIYRPAYDAEVEYLESTGTQWIDTGVTPDNTYTFDCKVAVTRDYYNCVYWGARDTQNDTNISNVYLNSNTAYVEVTLAHNIRLVSLSDWTDNRNWNSNIIPTVYTMYELTNITSVPDMLPTNTSVSLFGLNINGQVNTSVGICRIGYWKCYSNGVLVRDMIPVRIGSVGYMYDKVSKQLFANKGTGQFILGNDVSNAVIPQQRCVLYVGNQRSVGFERIYEEYEWLCGDGTKYIRIKGYTRNEYWTIKTKCRVRGAGWSDTYPQIYGAVYYNDIYGSWALFATKDVTVIAARGSSLSNYYDNYYDYNYNDVVSIIDEHNNISINNISKSTIAGRVYFDNDEFWLFSTFDNKYSSTNPKSRIADADISNFTITENGTTVLDLIPCKLLQSIPAILDGNGIARQAGECGMWDKVNDVFYGNVANSGSFTVSND